MLFFLSRTIFFTPKTKFFEIEKKEAEMAETVQVKLPPEMTPLFDEIRAVRATRFESLSNKAIVIDAIKQMHSKIKEQQ